MIDGMIHSDAQRVVIYITIPIELLSTILKVNSKIREKRFENLPDNGNALPKQFTNENRVRSNQQYLITELPCSVVVVLILCFLD